MTSPVAAGTGWCVSAQAALTSSIMEAGAKKRLSSGSTQLGKSAASFAAAISSGKLGRVPVFSPSSRRTDWIIHRPMMFFR